MSDQPQSTLIEPGPFALHDEMNRIVGTVTIRPDGAHISLPTSWPLGRQDLRKIAHRIMNIADFNTGLQE